MSIFLTNSAGHAGRALMGQSTGTGLAIHELGYVIRLNVKTLAAGEV